MKSYSINRKTIKNPSILKIGLGTKVGTHFYWGRLLSQDSLKSALKNFGATEKEAEVYIFLAKHGALKTGQIAKQMKTNKGLVYRVLSSLKQKGLVEATLEFPTRFTAVSLEKVIDSYVKAKHEEVALVEKTKQDLLKDWERISQTEVELPLEKFTVIEGSKKIYRKIAEIVEKTHSTFSAVSTVAGLANAEQFEVFDAAYAHPMKSKVEFRFLTELNQQNLKAFKLLKAELKAGLNIKARNPDLGLPLFPRMVIRDNEEILLFISPKKDLSTKKEEVCVHTNCGSLVQAFTGVFEDLWRNSTSIEEKMVEIETGKLTPKTLVIADEETAKEKYGQIVNAAENEIIMMTSARDLFQLSKNMIPFEELSKRNISIRIMAPIINENLSYAEKLSKYCEIRHVATSYLGTTVIDGKHLFQLRASSSDQKGPEQTYSFENTFYTTDSTYVQKIKNMLEDTWNSSYPLSIVTLYPVLRSHIGGKRSLSDKRDLKTLPERLLKAARAHKAPLLRSIGGTIIITPPKHLNMPDMRITATNFDKESPRGGGDLLRVDLWLDGPQGKTFVPVAIVWDGHPKAAAQSRAQFAGTPAGENVIQVKPEELQIWCEGKTLFAGWTIPIPLLPPKYKLEPACIFFEAFGDEFHVTTSHVFPSGYVLGTESDGFQAFTTYIAPSWRYSGPGISGNVSNSIMIVAKPKT